MSVFSAALMLHGAFRPKQICTEGRWTKKGPMFLRGLEVLCKRDKYKGLTRAQLAKVLLTRVEATRAQVAKGQKMKAIVMSPEAVRVFVMSLVSLG